MSGRWESMELGGVWRESWLALGEAVRTPSAPWRTPVVATAGDDGGGRVVVLRGVSEERRELVFHSDARAPKVAALKRSPWLTWVFYSPEWQVQLRVRARAMVHVGDSVAMGYWPAVPEAARGNYGTVGAPGSSMAHPFAQQYLEGVSERNFAAVVTEAVGVDWLWLRSGGHRRAGWDWNSREWSGTWRTP
jgi:3-hydroxyisobutyrate dehydrogenase